MDLSAATVHAALALVADQGWDGPAARDLLGLVRQRIVEPSVRRSGLRGPAADQACASGWAAAWDALRRPSAQAADNPAGMAWVAVRRAVAAEAASGRRGADAPAMDLIRDVDWDLLASADPLAARSDPGASGGALDPILMALRGAGWPCEQLAGLVDELAATTLAPGRRGSWRTAAERAGCPAWRASRLWTLLAGAPGLTGLVELVSLHGTGLLEDPDIEIAIRSTVRQWLPAPASSLRAAAHRREAPIALAGSPCPQAIWPMSDPPSTVRAPVSGGRDRRHIGQLRTTTGEGGRMPIHVQDQIHSRLAHGSRPVLLDSTGSGSHTNPEQT